MRLTHRDTNQKKLEIDIALVRKELVSTNQIKGVGDNW